jgi:hypothetical protein
MSRTTETKQHANRKCRSVPETLQNNGRKNMKLNLLGVPALALALTITGAPAATAQTEGGNVYLATTIDGTPYCLPAVPHGEQAYITSDVSIFNCSPIYFIGPFQISGNSNNWWEVEMSNGYCLNYIPSTEAVYSDDCIGDWNELWFNHISGELINLEGNATTGFDTLLFPNVTYPVGPNYDLYAGPDNDGGFSGWSEQGTP